MYECPNCNGNMKFDIPSQMLLCDYCGTQMKPDDFQKESDADEIMVNVFTCPQCGGELISNDTTAATFCSFCGSSTILSSRISKEKRPGYIIPFQKTKEDCRKAYGEMVRRAYFAPDEFKDEESISRFRSIYMPYWVYSFEKSEHVSFQGSDSSREGDYIIKRNYILECDVEAKYKGITFDAAASFSDDLSNAIAPFEWRDARPFTPAYLSGFYADTDDVVSQAYIEDARAMVTQGMCAQIKKESEFRRYSLGSDLSDAMEPKTVQEELAMLPVWFLTYRRGDRVSYAVVNGQTGKVSGDIPVDKKKYLLGSLLLALPIFLVLNLLVSMKANIMLCITAILAVICCIVSIRQKNALLARETGESDRGRWYPRNADSSYAAEHETEGMSHASRAKQKAGGANTAKLKKGLRTIWNGSGPVLLNIIKFAAVAFLFVGFRFVEQDMYEAIIFTCFVMVVAFFTIVVTVKEKLSPAPRRRRKMPVREMLGASVKPLIGLVLAVIVLLIKPVSDLYYYGAALVVMGLAVWDILGMIERYNLLATRELPQFHKRGGEEYER